jgi:hypothetical protein|tara:strand:- start:657 stop:1241 length:585 start_codon:yes stop_codon:yes gene_type:complete
MQLLIDNMLLLHDPYHGQNPEAYEVTVTHRLLDCSQTQLVMTYYNWRRATVRIGRAVQVAFLSNLFQDFGLPAWRHQLLDFLHDAAQRGRGTTTIGCQCGDPSRTDILYLGDVTTPFTEEREPRLTWHDISAHPAPPDATDPKGTARPEVGDHAANEWWAGMFDENPDWTARRRIREEDAETQQRHDMNEPFTS